jgi:hypothetical protein
MVAVVAQSQGIELPAGNVITGLSFGLAAAFMPVTFSPWLRYLGGCIVLAHRGDLPWRPAKFLDWAYDAGLVRMAGLTIQFRHLEFQKYLSQNASMAPNGGVSEQGKSLGK